MLPPTAKSLISMLAFGGMAVAPALVSVPVQAGVCATIPVLSLASTFEVVCGDKKFSEFSSVSFGNNTGNVVFSENGANHSIRFDFNSPYVGTGTYNFSYTMDITSSEDLIATTTLVAATGNPVKVSSKLTTLPPLPSPGVTNYTMDATLVVDPGDTAVQQWEHLITQTPGPLPILGAGAAFGFSRKLRRRIHQAS